jgi:hypothetical protein
MRKSSLLAAAALTCALTAPSGAYAGVKFIETFVGAGAQAEAWNGIAEKPKSDSESRSGKANTLKQAKAGITALPIASASSGGKNNAFADDAESASVQLTSKFNADFQFGGAAEAGITAGSGSGAFASAGGGSSDAGYEFRATSAERLTIDYTTVSDFDPGTFVYEITVGSKNGAPHEYFLGADGTNSITLDLTKGRYLVDFTVQQPNPLSAAIGDSLDQLTYKGDFHVTLAAIPEPSTWAMLLAGFAGLGFMTRRGARAAVAKAA